MTESEIIKALECCYNAQCSKCPYEIRCIKLMTKDALDLINRKNAEIERLKEFIETTRLCDKELKAEAIKEFVQRVKGVYSAPRYERPTAHTLIIKLFDNIDQIAKEMGVEL